MATKEEWKQGKRHPDTVYMADENTRIATCFSPNAEANAQLIVTAVNACQKVNPDNPQAVAESISDLCEALKAVSRDLEGGRGVIFPYTEKIVTQALAKGGGEVK